MKAALALQHFQHLLPKVKLAPNQLFKVLPSSIWLDPAAWALVRLALVPRAVLRCLTATGGDASANRIRFWRLAANARVLVHRKGLSIQGNLQKNCGTPAKWLAGSHEDRFFVHQACLFAVGGPSPCPSLSISLSFSLSLSLSLCVSLSLSHSLSLSLLKGGGNTRHLLSCAIRTQQTKPKV